MKMRSRALTAAVLLALASLWAGRVRADVHYVDRTHGAASDAGPGAQVQPWLTIGYGAAHISGGDTLIVRGGSEGSPTEYTERIESLPGGTPSAKTVIKAAPRRGVLMQGFFLQNIHNVRIEGFKIVYETMSWKGGGVQFRGDNAEIVDNRIENTPQLPAIYIRLGTGAYIAHNSLYKVQYGIAVTANAVVENNEIERLYQFDPDADCDYFRAFGDNIAIRNNHCHGTIESEKGDAHTDFFQHFSLLTSSPSPLTNAVIESNLLEGFLQQVFMGEDQWSGSSNIVFRNNVFKDFSGHGINVNQGYNGVHVLNNTFYSMGGSSAVDVDARSTATVRNNIFVGFEERTLVGACREDHNLFFQSRPPLSPDSSDVIDVDPLFVDTASGDYRLRNTSPAIDKGVDLSAFFRADRSGTVRPQGAAWDIGAYEYAPASNKPGKPVGLRVAGTAGMPVTGHTVFNARGQKIHGFKAERGCGPVAAGRPAGLYFVRSKKGETYHVVEQAPVR